MSTDPQRLSAQKPDYGIDAPGVRRGMVIAGIAGLILAAIVASLVRFGLIESGSAFRVIMTTLGLVVAVYGLYMGGYMTYGSRVGKLRTRDHLLAQVNELRPWQGGEFVLDIGCGSGLMMIGAAKRLIARKGLSVGVDLWRIEDQSANTPAAALENARIEGVADRVRIDTGDARALSYADESFDVVLSHWVIHNLPKHEDRLKALDEMLRVLRPGGVLVLADIACIAEHRVHLLARNVIQLRLIDGGLESRVMGVLSGGSYRPQALLACRA